MKKSVTTSLTILTSAFMLAVTATPVLAYSVHAEGGIWNYGVGSKYVWSYYSHNGRTHKSSVSGRIFTSSGWQKAGTEAKASAEKSWWGGNKSYYNVR